MRRGQCKLQIALLTLNISAASGNALKSKEGFFCNLQNETLIIYERLIEITHCLATAEKASKSKAVGTAVIIVSMTGLPDYIQETLLGV